MSTFTYTITHTHIHKHTHTHTLLLTQMHSIFLSLSLTDQQSFTHYILSFPTLFGIMLKKIDLSQLFIEKKLPVRKVRLQMEEDLGRKVTGTKLGDSKETLLWNLC